MRRCASVAGSAVCSITGPGCRRDGAAVSAPGMSASGVVWITGAGSGIGRATALRFLRAGAIVAGTARRVETLEAVAAAARDFTGRFPALPAALTDRQATGAGVHHIAEIGGA